MSGMKRRSLERVQSDCLIELRPLSWRRTSKCGVFQQKHISPTSTRRADITKRLTAKNGR